MQAVPGNPGPAARPLRLFVAITLPREVREKLQEAQSALRSALQQSAVSWVRVEQAHLTLRFLGSVEASHVPAIGGAIADITKLCRPLNLNAAGTGFFPTATRPGVAWAGVGGDLDALRELQSHLERAVGSFSAQPPEKEFTPHFTLARIKNFERADSAGLKAVAQRLSDAQFGAWTASEVCLYQSTLGAGGAQHAVLSTAPFQSIA